MAKEAADADFTTLEVSGATLAPATEEPKEKRILRDLYPLWKGHEVEGAAAAGILRALLLGRSAGDHNEYRVRADATALVIAANTGTEAAPVWTNRLTIDKTTGDVVALGTYNKSLTAPNRLDTGIPADYVYTTAGEKLVTGLSNLTIPGVDGNRRYDMLMQGIVENDTSSAASAILRLRVGSTGTLTDAVVLHADISLPATLNYRAAFHFERPRTPAAGDNKVSLTLECTQNATLKQIGTATPTRVIAREYFA